MGYCSGKNKSNVLQRLNDLYSYSNNYPDKYIDGYIAFIYEISLDALDLDRRFQPIVEPLLHKIYNLCYK